MIFFPFFTALPNGNYHHHYALDSFFYDYKGYDYIIIIIIKKVKRDTLMEVQNLQLRLILLNFLLLWIEANYPSELILFFSLIINIYF